jgi:hypothetical protein
LACAMLNDNKYCSSTMPAGSELVDSVCVRMRLRLRLRVVRNLAAGAEGFNCPR